MKKNVTFKKRTNTNSYANTKDTGYNQHQKRKPYSGNFKTSQKSQGRSSAGGYQQYKKSDKENEKKSENKSRPRKKGFNKNQK